MSTMRRIYQHFPSRPLAESLVALGYHEEMQDGSIVLHLDAYPAHPPRDAEFRLLVLPRQPVIPPGLPQRQTGVETQLERAPTGANEQAARVKSEIYPTPLSEAACDQMEKDLAKARAAIAAASAGRNGA